MKWSDWGGDLNQTMSRVTNPTNEKESMKHHVIHNWTLSHSFQLSHSHCYIHDEYALLLLFLSLKTSLGM